MPVFRCNHVFPGTLSNTPSMAATSVFAGWRRYNLKNWVSQKREPKNEVNKKYIYLELQTTSLLWLFQLDDSKSLQKKWLEITKHPLKIGCFGYRGMFYLTGVQRVKVPGLHTSREPSWLRDQKSHAPADPAASHVELTSNRKTRKSHEWNMHILNYIPAQKWDLLYQK